MDGQKDRGVLAGLFCAGLRVLGWWVGCGRRVKWVITKASSFRAARSCLGSSGERWRSSRVASRWATIARTGDYYFSITTVRALPSPLHRPRFREAVAAGRGLAGRRRDTGRSWRGPHHLRGRTGWRMFVCARSAHAVSAGELDQPPPRGRQTLFVTESEEGLWCVFLRRNARRVCY